MWKGVVGLAGEEKRSGGGNGSGKVTVEEREKGW